GRPGPGPATPPPRPAPRAGVGGGGRGPRHDEAPRRLRRGSRHHGEPAMNKRRRWLLATLAGFAVLGMLGVLALFDLHWRLYGWWRGEPFCDGLPASYYAARLRAAWEVRTDLGGSVRPREYTAVENWLRGHHARGVADALWPDCCDSNDAPQPFGPDTPGAAKLPVLLVLLNDADVRVRWWASEKLARVDGEAAPTA